MANQPGFVIPNAQSDPRLVTNRQAEPDAGDFSVLGNGNNGILTGFDYSVTGGEFRIVTASNINVAIINGEIYRLSSDPLKLVVGLAKSSTGADRFDLVVFHRDTGLTVLQGGADPDIAPTFPELVDNAALLAAVWVPGGAIGTTLTLSNLIDKRKWVLNGARGAVGDGYTFLENRRPVGETLEPTFKVMGDGQMLVGTNTKIVPEYDTGAAKLSVSGFMATSFEFRIVGKGSVSGNFLGDSDITAVGALKGKNLISGPVVGEEGMPPNDVGITGTLYQDMTNGRVYIRRKFPNPSNESFWAEIYADEYPPGTIISTLLPDAIAPDYMTGSWLKLNGQLVRRDKYATLARCFPGWIHDDVFLELPDLTESFLGSSSNPDELGMTHQGSNEVTLTEANLPSHHHFPTSTEAAPLLTGEAGNHNHGNAQTGANGAHGHTIPYDGIHAHGINDPEHRHMGMDHGYNVPSPAVHMRWGGAHKVDMLFNDANHGPTVDFSDATVFARTGITQTNNDGQHSHSISGEPAHAHSLVLSSTGTPHTHTLPVESKVGKGESFDNRPSFFVVNWYIHA